MTTDEELRIAAAKYVMDAIPSWELSALANRLVDGGLTTRAAIDLATLRAPTMAEAGPLFERILEAAHVAAPSKDEAIWVLLRHYVGAIANGSVEPSAGLGQMMDVFRRAGHEGYLATQYVGDSYDIQDLVGAYWSYDDIDDAEQQSLDADVVLRAQEWITRHA